MNISMKFVLIAGLLVLLMGVCASAQEMGHGGNVSERKLTTVPPLPTCARGKLMSGDMATGNTIIFSSIATNCTIPWHWHTPTEHVMIASGVARIDIKGEKSLTLRAGGFAMLPSKHVHQFHCNQACEIFVYSDLPFDLHYVNAKGDEITPAEANKAIKQTAATEMK